MDKRLTVAHVISDAGIGGAQVYVWQLLQRMNVDFRLIVICPKEGYYVEKYEQEVEVISVNFQLPHHRLLFQLRTIFQQQQVDVVHAHLMKACVFSAFAAVGLRGVNVLASLHGDLLPETYRPIAFQFYKTVNRLASFSNIHYLCISFAEQKALKKQGIHEAKTTVVHNAVDTEHFHFQPISYQKEEQLKTVFIGRFHQQKGILTLLRVASRLPEVQFTLIGEGNLATTIQQATAELTNIQVHPFQSDIRSFLAAAHLFVFPSNWEGFGIAIVEAMAIGRAVVTTKVGGIPELIEEGQGGFLCASRQVDCLVEAIQKFQNQPELIERFGRYNRQKAESQFSLSRLTTQLKNIYLR